MRKKNVTANAPLSKNNLTMSSKTIIHEEKFSLKGIKTSEKYIKKFPFAIKFGVVTPRTTIVKTRKKEEKTDTECIRGKRL